MLLMLENRYYFLFLISQSIVGAFSFNHRDTPSPRATRMGPHDLKQGKVFEAIPTHLLLFWIVVLDEIPFGYL
jgi:hypothetical protein